MSNFRTLRTRFSPFEPNLRKCLASLWRLQRILSVFPSGFNKFNNTGARMQDSIYLLTLRSHFISNVCTKTSRFLISKSSLCIDLDIYFLLYITKNAACQMGQIAAIFDFITTCIGLVVALCVTCRTFRRNPYHNKGRFTPWTFRPKSTRTQVLDILCPISGHFGPALVHSNQI